MTAEVAILNRHAVAVAADSAVSLAADSKVYDTANKILTLSSNPPILVMFYGAASLGRIPWDTIVHQYQQSYSNISFSTVEQHASHFVDFLQHMVAHISEELQRDFVRMEISWELDQLCETAYGMASMMTRSTPVYDSTFTKIFWDQMSIAARMKLEYFDRIRPLADISEREAKRQLELAVQGWSIDGMTAGNWNEFVDIWFTANPALRSADLGRPDRTLRRDLEASTIKCLRTAEWSPGCTGVVVIGFGTDQPFPSMVHWLIDQVMSNTVKARVIDVININDECPSIIYPLARQHEMAQTLIEGIHPQLREAHYNLVGSMLNELSDQVAEILHSKMGQRKYRLLMSEVSARFDKVAHAMSDMFERRIAYHSAPLINLVEHLPKHQLAEMAETLVHMASFQQKFTPGTGVVGGPIDVAVISHTEGTVWVKRKDEKF